MTVEVEVDEPTGDSPDVVVVDTGDSGGSDILDATTVVLVDRVARLEMIVAALASTVEELQSSINMAQVTAEIAEDTAETAVELVEELASDVPAIAEDVADTTTSEPDEPPTSKEHWFFKKWGSD